MMHPKTLKVFTTTALWIYCLSFTLKCSASEQAKAGPKMKPSLSAGCPNQEAMDLFKHQIAFQRDTWEAGADPLRSVAEIHADVWQRGKLTGFYVRDKLPNFSTNVRDTYLFGTQGLQGGGTCPAEEVWQNCVEKFAGTEYANARVVTCKTTINVRIIPAWKPSPNSEEKRRLAEALRKEIEADWKGVSEIVVQDFNFKDPTIMMYLKMPDGDYYEGCDLHASTVPHCDSWHMFGMAPISSLRKAIFRRPYRLK